ncbi:hypothetical protein EELLY_v1c06980 [Entomoplasma ellychniae]|uniref:Beta-lactamase-related domain-containing protein n=1 Tax=Entomoplasma ellychniae TaxID=2114 RepID=A0A8E2UB29_9MOLU|nr:serine hydrolase domain-containing protein [Entomoplasma ellychniae]PPE05010.1 hypothetical protein EELLY_v1c06980 [Entomoplasma ellychniae]
MIFNKTQKTINKLITEKVFHGAVIKIVKDNKELFFDAFGYNDFENNVIMKKDNIFSLYSMSKPITVVAALILQERKQLCLEENIQKYYPNFSKVITIKQLLTMTSGLTYFWDQNKSTLELQKIKKKIEEENITLQEFCQLVSKIELEYNPGQDWHYGLSLDILGGIIEKITNMKFQDFVLKEIAKPLKMNDTDFEINDLSRKTVVYASLLNETQNILKPNHNWSWMLAKHSLKTNAAFGGHGIFSTTDDYSKFLNSLLVSKHHNQHLISTASIKEMSSDQIGDLKTIFNQRSSFNSDYTYGYGVRVRLKNKNLPLTEIEEFGWDGALGSFGIVDPVNNITITFMISTFPGNNKLVRNWMWEAIYEDLRNSKII